MVIFKMFVTMGITIDVMVEKMKEDKIVKAVNKTNSIAEKRVKTT